MESALVDQAIELLDKANAELEPELLPAAEARRLLACYARARRLVDFAIAGLSRKLDDASEVARATGTSMGQAKAVVTTGQVLAESDELSAALQQGAISLDQANEIAAAEQSCPGAAHELVAVAKKEAFHVLKDKARTTKLEAERDRDLSARQRAARRARSYADELGMVCIDLTVEPHVGTPIVARAEAEAARLAKAAGDGAQEPFERHLADAYGLGRRAVGEAGPVVVELGAKAVAAVDARDPVGALTSPIGPSAPAYGERPLRDESSYGNQPDTGMA